MGALLRSEDMILLRVVFDEDAAHDTMEELGKVGLLEFQDQNRDMSSFQRHFAPNVRRCDEMQRRLRFLDREVRKLGYDPDADAEADARRGGARSIAQVGASGASSGLAFNKSPTSISLHLRFDELEEHLMRMEANLQSINGNWEQLQSQYNQLLELKFVLEKGAEFFKNAPDVRKAERGGGGGYGSIEPSFAVDSAPMFGSRTSSDVRGEDLLLGRRSVSTSQKGASGSGASDDLLTYTTGVLNKERLRSFDRLLFRASRGNAFLHYAELSEKLLDEETGERVDKVVFIIFHFGRELGSKVDKICKAYQASVYDFPEDAEAQLRAYATTTERLHDLDTILNTTASHRSQLLAELSPQLPSWSDFVLREKAIYHSLNLINTEQKLYVASAWAPTVGLDSVRRALDSGRRSSHALVPSVLEAQRLAGSGADEGEEGYAGGENEDDIPPTYFRTNKFTAVFHDIVESYAIAAYKEINPAPFSVISFPFLFAVMFGDMGHGAIMAAVAILVILFESRLGSRRLDELSQTVFDGRYIILLMGVFSVFTGLIYNEFFAVPLNLFGGRWKYTDASSMACGIDNCDDPAAVRAPLSPYPIGFDPIWKTSGSALLFFNSYKMKLSILLGVAQMLLGIVLSYFNARHFKRRVDVLFVFIPQMIFMNAIFGYLCMLIILKWCINYDSASCRAEPNCLPPDIKAILISMFMAPGSLEPTLQMFPLQNPAQVVLLVLALISVPVMLLAKPLVLKRQHDQKVAAKKKRRQLESGGGGGKDSGETQRLLASESGGGGQYSGGRSGPGKGGTDEDDDDDEENHGHGPTFEFGEVMVHNMIHTIEFVLGCVSNTASYLRLWALSLAHAELSEVFLEKLMFMGASSGNVILLVVCFVMWMVMTIGVLMLMESLSAFLHALRLHWVEFQNKFYSLEGPGRKFAPFSFDAVRAAERA